MAAALGVFMARVCALLLILMKLALVAERLPWDA